MEKFIFQTSDGTMLESAVFEPSRPAKGDILFQLGFSGTYDGYQHLILPLSECYKVVTYNPRDHGNSQGRISAKNWASDSAEIYNAHCQNGAIVAHSYGAIALQSTEPKSFVLINPALSTRFHEKSAARIIHALHEHKDDRYVQSLDNLFARKRTFPLRRKLQTVAHPLSAIAALDEMDIAKRKQQPILYFCSDDEQVRRNQQLYRNLLYNMSSRAQDASDLVQGLNHCLNYKGIVPFFKEEPGKDRQKVVRRITDFLEKTL